MKLLKPKHEIIEFTKKIHCKYDFDLKLLNQKEYTINIEKPQKYNCNLCHAKITIDGVSRQCSRKKKYGKLCGLHSKKSDQDMYTINDSNTIKIKPFMEIQNQKNNKKNKQIDSFVINLFKNTKAYNDQNNWSLVSINNNKYRYNVKTNQILTENGVKYFDIVQKTILE